MCGGGRGGGVGAQGEYGGGIRGGAGKGRVPGRWGFSKGGKGKKLGEIRQHRLILHNTKRAEVAGKVKKKRRRKVQIQGKCGGKMDPLWVLRQGFLYLPLFPFSLLSSPSTKKETSYSGYDFFYSSSVTNLTMRKRKSDPFETRLNKARLTKIVTSRYL